VRNSNISALSDNLSVSYRVLKRMNKNPKHELTKHWNDTAMHLVAEGTINHDYVSSECYRELFL